MVAAQKKRVQSLRTSGSVDAEERVVHEATLRYLQSELSRKQESKDSTRARLLHEAEILSDVVTFVVPPSHRKDTLGKAVTFANRADLIAFIAVGKGYPTRLYQPLANRFRIHVSCTTTSTCDWQEPLALDLDGGEPANAAPHHGLLTE